MYRILITFFIVFLVSSCGNLRQDIEEIFDKSNSLDEIDLSSSITVRTLSADTKKWDDVVTNSAEILAAEIAITDAKRDAEIIATAKSLQVNSTIQAGSMSIADQKNGLLGTLNIDQLISDFGQTDAKILQANVNVELAELNYLKTIDDELLEAALALDAWESSYDLMNLTYSKQVLAEPLIDNLRRLASAGQIDAIQLANAEKSLSQLELTRVRAGEAVRKAETTLKKFFTTTPDNLDIDLQDLAKFAEKLKKLKLSDSVPYRVAAKQKSLAELNLLAHKVSKRGSIVARSKVDVPAADNMESDASVGFVYSINLRDGERHETITSQLETKLRQAESDLLAVTVDLRTRHSDLQTKKEFLQSANNLRVGLIRNVEGQISQLEDQLAIGSTSFNDLLGSHIELYQLQREVIEANSELARTNLELVALNGDLVKFLKVKLTVE